MRKLFKTKPADEKRSIRYPILLTEKEAMAIRNSALIRNLSVAEFIRRAALGRKADVRYETEIVLALREVAHAIKKMHADFVEKKILPTEFVEWRVVIQQATAAMLRVGQNNFDNLH